MVKSISKAIAIQYKIFTMTTDLLHLCSSLFEPVNSHTKIVSAGVFDVKPKQDVFRIWLNRM